MSVKDGEGRSASQDGRAYELFVYPRLSADCPQCCTLKVHKEATAASVIQDATSALGLDPRRLYVLAEVKECGGEEWVLESGDLPVQRVLLWPRKAQEQHPQSEGFYFLLQERNRDGSIHYVHLPAVSKEQEVQELAARGFLPPRQDDFDDLCNLPELNESSILNNLRNRFRKNKIYTYAGSILIAINPFKFLPIYNPKYVKMYENHQLGKLEPHIFAIADVAYYAMLRKRVNQCIVISGESGSGKTQSTNFLIHCLTALSQKGYASGVERTILGAGPVLEAFGNAKTAHNNNSSRFGKFIQVNYLESGVVRGAIVEKYLLEKSRLVSREKNERNYHVFYYLLVGASAEERKEFKLLQPEDYLYLKQVHHDFTLEAVSYIIHVAKLIFSVLSAILYLGNVTYRRKSTGRDEGLDVGPPEVLATLSGLLKVKEELLVEALTKRKTVTVNDKLILPYSHSEAITARDSMAKSLYSALFDWIVLRINHALLNKKDMEESVPCLSIGVLDIFGFEDFKTNSFEQFCINYANEQLQYYFNQHIFKLEQEEYQAEGITWHNIDYTDNVGCIHLISKKPTGLLYLLDEESNFPHATDKTLLAKFKQQHQENKYFVPTPVMEPAFVIQHFAGKVKYQIKDFREKNTDHMRPDIVALLRSSDRAYVRQLIGMDPVAMFRWGILRATIRGMAAFNEAGRRWAVKTAGTSTPDSWLDRSNTPVEKMYRDMHAQIISSIKDLQLDGEDPRKLLQSWGRLRFPRHLLQKSKNAKHKQIIPKSLLDSRSLKYIVGRTLHDRTGKSLLHLNKKKKTPSISAQFQTSLTKLLETLGGAEPFFIRCIRSNSEKKEMCLNENLVVQQLRYTGMLETVRIRRSGYGAKYTFQEFIEHFRVLLPKNAKASKPEDIAALFQRMELDPTTYQIGKTKVYLKELERQQLQDMLHKDVMRKILFLQRWFRARLERTYFLEMRRGAIVIQVSVVTRPREAAERRAREEEVEGRLRQAQNLSEVTEKQVAAERSDEGRHENSVPVKEEPREAVEHIETAASSLPGEVQKGAGLVVHQPDEGSSTATEAVFQAEVEGQVMDKLQESNFEEPEEEGSTEGAAAPSPEAAAAESVPSADPVRVPQLHKVPSSRSQEKREQRRQRGLEHSQRESERVASAATPKVTGKEAASRPECKPKERAESKELDQYTFVAWKKEEKGKKEPRNSPTQTPVRPSTLPVNPPEPVADRNGTEALGAGHLVRYVDQGAMKEKAEKWKGRKSGGQQLENTSPPEAQNKDRGKKHSQYTLFSLNKPFDHLSLCRTAQPSSQAHPNPLAPQSSLAHPGTAGGDRTLSRNPSIKISRATRVSEQWNASLDREITNANELRHLDEFLGNQVRLPSVSTPHHTHPHYERCIGKSRANKHTRLLTPFLICGKQKPHIGYKNLMRGYQNKVISLAGDRQKGEVQLVINLFQSVLDGFIRGEIKKEEGEPAKPAKARKKRRKKDKSMENPLDHVFSTYQVNIMQSCDQCTSYIWGMEKAYMCSHCKMVAHKKCLGKIVTDCSTFCAKKVGVPNPSVFLNPLGMHFGVRVCHLTSDKSPVPVVLEIMLEHVEMNGLYTEGIYRKSGSANRMKELHQLMETDPHAVCLDDYPIHTVTGLVKQWLRELPDPLMTFNLYNDFLRAVELPEKPEQLHAIYKVLEQLPTACFNTLERLIFHLVRVSKEESHNRMSPNSLAIVFAPCILRCPDSADPLMSMKDVAKTTTCVEMLINEQIRRYNEKMEEIEQLEFAEALAVNQLKLKRQNTLHWHLPLRFSAPYKGVVNPQTLGFLSDASDVLSIPREELACRLPELEQPGSDQENLDSEASVSSESLLEEHGQPPGPSDQRTPGEHSSHPSLVPAVVPASFSASRLQLHRRWPIIPSTVKLPSGVPAHPSAAGPASRADHSLSLVRRREPLARRKDSTQSLYISPGKDLFPPSAPLSLQATSKAHRRFSDAGIPYVEEA
uniref:Myosin IXB n=1 Tax=Esox lucius TaxID=8010 RepID=A0AAY5KPV2_ESOLU